MQTWEYLRFEADIGLRTNTMKLADAAGERVDNREAFVVLNELGDQGWEAVGVASHSARNTIILLKRPKQ